MAFGSLSAAHQVMILLSLKGGPEYDAQMAASAGATGKFGKALLDTSAAMDTATKRSWLHNQALFTARRYAFYATLAVTGLAYEVLKLGFSYNSTVQSAKVALKGMFDTRQEMNRTIRTLYDMSTFSPFLFKDTLTAFRTMAPAMKNAGVSVHTTLGLMRATMDALSQSGHATTGNLTRVSIQLQHLANIGRPTGQILIALARDGLPVYPALRKELGLTGTSLEQLASTGITAQQMFEALTKYIETSPIYRGQAFKQATQTLAGNWQMFKDILSQAAGSSESGLFTGLTNRLKQINVYLRPFVTSGRPVGLYQIAEAIDRALTPNTHIILNLFIMFTTVIKTVTTEIGLLVRAVGYLLRPLDELASLFGVNHLVSKLFGIALGSILTLFIVGKAVLFPFVLMMDLWKTAVMAARTAAIVYRVVLAILNGEWATAAGLIGLNTTATEANTEASTANTMSYAQRMYIMGALSDSLVEVTTATEAATPAMFGFGAALDFMLGPIGLVIAGLSAIIIFHKQIAGWGGRIWGGVSSFVQHPIRGIHNIKKHPGHAGHTLMDFMFPEVMIAKHLFHFQHGGYAGLGGNALVGEGGPELVHLPAGASVHPIPSHGLGGGLRIIVEPQDIYFDSKKIGTIIAKVVTDQNARSGGRNT